MTFFSYYILRAVRDDISFADRGDLQLLWTAVFFVPMNRWFAGEDPKAVRGERSRPRRRRRG